MIEPIVEKSVHHLHVHWCHVGRDVRPSLEEYFNPVPSANRGRTGVESGNRASGESGEENHEERKCSIHSSSQWAHVCPGTIITLLPGSVPLAFPPEAGLPAGGDIDDKRSVVHIMLEVHYANPALSAALRDTSGVRLWYSPYPRPFLVGTATYGPFNVGRPEHASDGLVPAASYYEMTAPCPSACSKMHGQQRVVFAEVHHMHELGVSAYTTLGREVKAGVKGGVRRGASSRKPMEEEASPGATSWHPASSTRRIEEQVVHLTEYYTHWHQRYVWVNYTVEPGDVVTLHCVWNNTLPFAAGFGSHAGEEMCGMVQLYYPRIEGLSICGVESGQTNVSSAHCFSPKSDPIEATSYDISHRFSQSLFQQQFGWPSTAPPLPPPSPSAPTSSPLLPPPSPAPSSAPAPTSSRHVAILAVVGTSGMAAATLMLCVVLWCARSQKRRGWVAVRIQTSVATHPAPLVSVR